MLRQVTYRARQFWSALAARPAADDLKMAGAILSPGEMRLFNWMKPAEQAHSLVVMKKLQAEAERAFGPAANQLLAAALLHDVGKTRYPLSIWERVEIVLVNKFFPQKVEIWGQSNPEGWMRPFVIAMQHPEWGAEMAAATGSSTGVVELIRRHQNLSSQSAVTIEDQMLQLLQQADQDS
jgi:putative nucleotidyltransferase with HDIG domain